MMNQDFLMGFGAGKAAGGGGGGGVTVESLPVSSNGTYTAPTGKAYSPVVVNVPNSYAAGDEGKVVSSGALVSQTAHAKVTQNGTIDTTLNNSVEVDVANSYAAGDEGKVVSNGALVAQTSDTVTQNGTVDTTLINSLLVNVSGGASNVVTGTFTGEAGGSMNIDLPYTGNGIPMAVCVFSVGGERGGDLGSAVWKGATTYWFAVKANDTVPNYSSAVAANKGTGSCSYKNSDSSSTSYSVSNNNYQDMWTDTYASNSFYYQVRVRSNTKIAVYIAGSPGTYGFAKGYEYAYAVVYSS